MAATRNPKASLNANQASETQRAQSKPIKKKGPTKRVTEAQPSVTLLSPSADKAPDSVSSGLNNDDEWLMPPPDHELTLRVVAMPSDANPAGDIFGGWIMSQVDIAGGVLAARRARGRVATVAVNSFVFRKPVLIGDVVSCYAKITREGRSSVTIHVTVLADRNPEEQLTKHVTEATLTYVAIGADRKSRPLPTR